MKETSRSHTSGVLAAVDYNKGRFMDTPQDIAQEQIESLALAIVEDCDNFDTSVESLVQEGWSERDARQFVSVVYTPSDLQDRMKLFAPTRLEGSLF